VVAGVRCLAQVRRKTRTTVATNGPRWSRPVAFTLIELVLLVVIVATIMVIGMGAYSGSVTHQGLQAAVDRVCLDLALARQYAITTGVNQTVEFEPGTGGYSVPGMPDPDRASRTYSIDLSVDPYQALIVSAVCGTDSEIIFDRYGVPDSRGRVVLEVGDRRETVRIDEVTGVIQVE
jgi:type II secretory pathway pseudopilin PulG